MVITITNIIIIITTVYVGRLRKHPFCFESGDRWGKKEEYVKMEVKKQRDK